MFGVPTVSIETTTGTFLEHYDMILRPQNYQKGKQI